jgi:hypothetical protein
MMGKVVHEKTIEDFSTQTTLDLTQIAAGIYTLHLHRSSTIIEKRKLIKQ